MAVNNSSVYRSANGRRTRNAFYNARKNASPAARRRKAETRRRSVGTI